MALLLVTYNSSSSESSLKKILEAQPEWWHYLENSWLIRTNDNAAQLYSKLSTALTEDDRILIVEITRNYEGWLPQKAWDWIKERL